MARLTILIATALLLAPTLARADVAPDYDKYTACDGMLEGASCVVSIPDFYEGTCKNIPCETDPQMTCLTCVSDEASSTGGEGTAGGTAGEGTQGPTTGVSTGGTAGEGMTTEAVTTGGASSSGGSTGANGSTGGSTGSSSDSDSKGGCSCRSGDAPATGGLAMLLGAALLRRRRR